MYKSGFVAIVGLPNSGKSTLINQLVGHKVTIVTHKVQTTRKNILGIVTTDKCQIILIDTPGVFRAKTSLGVSMVKSAWMSHKKADITILMIDASCKRNDDIDQILLNLDKDKKKHLVLCLNKIDQLKKTKLLKLSMSLYSKLDFKRVFMISALRGLGLKSLKEYLSFALPYGPLLYPRNQISNLSHCNMIEEVVREKVFLNIHQELPYLIFVKTNHLEIQKNGSFFVYLTIYVDRNTQKYIVLGKKGETIRRISIQARKDLELFFNQKIQLYIFIKVDKYYQCKYI